MKTIDNRTEKTVDIWDDLVDGSPGLKTSFRNSFVFSKTTFFVFGLIVAALGLIIILIGIRAVILAFYTNFFLEETPPVYVGPPQPLTSEQKVTNKTQEQMSEDSVIEGSVGHNAKQSNGQRSSDKQNDRNNKANDKK